MRTSAWFGWSATVLVLASCAVTACGEDDEGSLIPDFDGGAEGDASGDGSTTRSDGSTPGPDGGSDDATPGTDSSMHDVFVPDTDAGDDAGVDSGGDSGLDSSADAGEDAGIDSGTGDDDDDTDAGTDAGEDAGEDAGVDMDAGSDASDAGNNGGTCSVSLSGLVTFIPLEAQGPAGFKVQYGACAEATTTAGASFGGYSLSAEPGNTGSITTTGDATHRTTVTSYIDTDLLADGPALYLPANTFASPFDATKAHAMILVVDDSNDESCPIEGVTVTIPDHAEGAVKYLDVNGVDQGTAISQGTGASDAGGVAYFSGLTPGSDFLGATLDNLPLGCTANYFYTVDGRTPLVAGAVSILNVRLTK